MAESACSYTGALAQFGTLACTHPKGFRVYQGVRFSEAELLCLVPISTVRSSLQRASP